MYTIRQVAEMTGFSPDTLRYYEKVSLLEPVRRGTGRVRMYSDDDVYALTALKCLKKTGLTLEDIKEFLKEGCIIENDSLAQNGGDTAILKRVRILSEHLERMEEQRRELDDIIQRTKQKLRFYTELLQKDR